MNLVEKYMAMIEQSRSRILKEALLLSLKKLAPHEIPMSGPERLKTRDYYSVSFYNNEGKHVLLLDGRQDDCFKFLSFEQASTEEVTKRTSELAGFTFQAIYYLREIRCIYASPAWLLLSHFLRLPLISLYWDRLSGWVYRRKTLVRRNRLVVLKFIHHQTTLDSQFAVDPFALMWMFYGRRWPIHPDRFPLLNYQELLLDSLVSSGDLLKTANGKYRLAAQALDSLSKEEKEDRQHRDQRMIQWILAMLTLFIAAAAVIQAYVAYFGSRQHDS